MRLAVLTTGRQDWGSLRSVCAALREDPAFDLRLLVGGMHVSARFGRTVRLIEGEGFVPAALLPWIPDRGDAPAAEQAAVALRLCAEALRRERPDALLLLGDRFETAAAALAATLCLVPIVHLHGGEETEGAFDNALRHAVTKLAHLHLVSHPAHAARVIAMGEAPGAVHTVGAPGLDGARRIDLPDRGALEASLGLPLSAPVVVVTLHPATLGGDPGAEAAAVVAAMDAVPATYVVTLPNADPGHEAIRTALRAAAGRPGRVAVEALGEKTFWGLLAHADAVLGNSSSALIEAPALGVPAVNVGDRQKGRLRGKNVIDAVADTPAIVGALRRALDPQFRRAIGSEGSPYGDGRSGARIVDVLRGWRPPVPPRKPAVAGAVR